MSLISNGVSSLGNDHTSKNGTSATDLIGNSNFAVTFFILHSITPIYIGSIVFLLSKRTISRWLQVDNKLYPFLIL